VNIFERLISLFCFEVELGLLILEFYGVNYARGVDLRVFDQNLIVFVKFEVLLQFY